MSGAEGGGTAPARAAGTRARRERRAAAGSAPSRGTGSPAQGPPSGGGRARPRRAFDPDVLAALEEQRDFLLRSLDDLEREHDAGDVADDDYEALKDDYTARAAAAIRSIEHRHGELAAARDARRGARGRSIAVAAAVLVLAIGAGVAVAQSSGRRGARDSLSGDIRQSTRDQLLEAQSLFVEGRYFDAIQVYDAVLEQRPNDPEALAYKGWLLRLASRQMDDSADREVVVLRALESLDAAVRADPDYADARVFRAVLLRDLGRPADALADLDRLGPGAVPPFMEPMVDNLRAQLVSAPGTTLPPPPPEL